MRIYIYIYIYVHIYIYIYVSLSLSLIFPACKPRRHQTCHFRKLATSAPAEGPAYGLDFARCCEFSLRTLQAQK